MSISPPPRREFSARQGPYYLADFDHRLAHTVAGWVGGPGELFWLAPKTFPPLTAEKVVAWTSLDGCPLLFYRQGIADPLGYVELNPMPGERHHLWMGHCVIRPQNRGVGMGRQMVRLMLHEAFSNRSARRVSLVVFPDNHAAVRCYRSVGFVDDGVQLRYFPTTSRQHRMLQMTLHRDALRRQA
jgi:RimJ/RimL family protein N-acetyltransferase